MNRLLRDYPAVSILSGSALLALLYPLFGFVFPEGRPLPNVSGAAFLFAGSLNAHLVFHALYAERQVRVDPPLWRTRLALVGALYFFVATTIMSGTTLPSSAALVQLGAGLVFGALMARTSWHDEIMPGPKLVDLDRPLWTTRMGYVITTYSSFAVLSLAVLVSLLARDTGFGLFTVIICMPTMMSFLIKNKTRWREREWLVFSGVGGLVVGAFTSV